MPWRESRASAAVLTVLRTDEEESHELGAAVAEAGGLLRLGLLVPSYLELPH